MKIGTAVSALLAAVVIAGVAPAESGQKPGTEELQRRREAIRERRDELRRARQAARRGPMASEPFTAVAKIGRQGTLTLVNAAGAVTITGGGGNDVRIEAVKRVWDPSAAEARSRLANVAIEVTERRDAVDVRTDFERQLGDAEVEFTITVPAGTNVSIRTGSGDVTVSGIRGELRAEAVGGGIKATSLGQVRLLRTLSGNVSLENAESNDVTVSTLAGAVTIHQLKARSADVRTVSGDLTVTDSESERLIAQSLSGRVEMTGPLARTGRYSLQSQSGDIRFIPIGTEDFELEAATVSGSVRSEFPITVDDRQVSGSDGGGRGVGRGRGRGRGAAGSAVNPRIVRGVSGNGGPLVTARSFRGDITISRR
jgi:hypothetical protein